MKTFDKLWEESEKIALDFVKQNNLDELSIQLELIKAISCNNISKIDLAKTLFLISYISAKYNINIYPALEEYKDMIKSDLLDINNGED